MIFILAILYRVSETKLIRLSLLLSMLGMAGLALFTGGTKITAAVMVVIYSLGEHILFPIRDSISVHSSKQGKEGLGMGLTRSFGNIGMIAGFYAVSLIFFLSRKFFHIETDVQIYRTVFSIAALSSLGGLIFVTRLKKDDNHIQRPKFILKRKYRKYYILEIFSGARKQIFMTFAPYVLIVYYKAPTELIATLYGIYSLANIFMNPVMGRLVDKIGYRAVLIIDYTILVLLCLIYGFSHRLFSIHTAFIVVSVIFVLDAVLFSAGIARSVYARKLSTNQAEMTATLSSGMSINHLISVLIALLGGYIWQGLGIETLFSLAALFGLAGIFFALKLENEKDIKPNAYNPS